MFAVAITGCNRNDLSDINKLYQARLDAETGDVEFNAKLTPEQVTATSIINSDQDADAHFIFDVNSGGLTGDVTFAAPQNESVQAVEIHRGRSGHTGPVVASLIPDASVPGQWRLADNFNLNNGEADQLLNGDVYVLASTAQHTTGELRAQLLPEWKQLLVHSLTPEQVVDGPVTTGATARSFLILDLADNALQGSVRYSPDIAPSDISLYTGLAGQTGERVFHFEPDLDNAGAWNVPDGQVMTETVWQRLEAAELYIQIASTAYPGGELRTQVYYPYFGVWTVGLSAATLGSQAPMGAAGKAYVTVEGGEVVSGNIRAIVRITGMAVNAVSLMRINNASNPNSRQLLFSLEPIDDYWRLPADAVLETKDFNAIGNGKLYFIATSADPMAWEIAGML